MRRVPAARSGAAVSGVYVDAAIEGVVAGSAGDGVVSTVARNRIIAVVSTDLVGSVGAMPPQIRSLPRAPNTLSSPGPAAMTSGPAVPVMVSEVNDAHNVAVMPSQTGAMTFSKAEGRGQEELLFPRRECVIHSRQEPTLEQRGLNCVFCRIGDQDVEDAVLEEQMVGHT